MRPIRNVCYKQIRHCVKHAAKHDDHTDFCGVDSHDVGSKQCQITNNQKIGQIAGDRRKFWVNDGI